MHTPRNVNDGSTHPPRLLIYGNEWGLSELPRHPQERAWTLEETLDKLVSAGFDGFQGSIATAEPARKRGLRFATCNRINTPAEADLRLREAADAHADAITLHVGWGMESDAEIDALVTAILEASARYDMPAFIETHRATITENMWRIHQLIQRIPQVRFNGDYSHLYLTGEVIYPGFDNVRKHFTPILQRTGFFHGRVSNAESIQVDIGDGRSNQHAKNFQGLWTDAMTAWLKTAKPGDILPFTPEVGPPSCGYSISYLDSQNRMVEISDRWAQTLVVKRLAEEAFASAKHLLA